jgi:hypothetical protein
LERGIALHDVPYAELKARLLARDQRLAWPVARK